MKNLVHRASIIVLVLMLMTTFFQPGTVAADSQGVLYTVQSGDTLASIAQAFHTTTARIMAINYFTDPNNLYPGRRVIIPGFEDVQGEVIRVTLPFGESLSTYLKRTKQPLRLLERLNFITNIDQAYAGAPVFKMYTEEIAVKDIPITAGLTGLELAVKQDTSNWSLTVFNGLRGPWELIPNEMVFLPDDSEIAGVVVESTPILTVSPFPLLQGKTAQLIAAPIPEGATLGGILTLSINDSLGTSSNYQRTDFPLHFFAGEDGRLTALQGVHRFTKPGLVPMVLTTTYADGATFSVQQNLVVNIQDYGQDAPLVVDESFIDPDVTLPEWEMVKTYVQSAPPEKQWVFGFHSPSPTPDGWTSLYGRVRSYNDSDYIYFHSGIDYTGNYSTPIFAAADGDVVYVGDLDVRGGATIISHGWGVYTGYWHQSQIDVKVGDHVTVGQTIGMVGDKGRVTGAHLHFEVFVGGVQVDPMDWLQGLY